MADVVFSRNLRDQQLYPFIFFYSKYPPARQTTDVVVMRYKYLRQLNFILPAYLYPTNDAALFEQLYHPVDTRAVDFASKHLV